MPVTVARATTAGVVAAGHPATVDAATGVLRAGGNAYDAAVAAGFAAAVGEPCLSSLGGGGFLLARTAAGDAASHAAAGTAGTHTEEVLFDFFVDTPGRGRSADAPEPRLTPVTLRFGSAEQVFHVGHASVAVPGCLSGYLHVHRRLGRLPLADVVAPAVRLAADGVVLGPDQASVVRLLEPIFSLTAEARALFVPDGRPFADDEVVVNLPLARFLERVAAGEVVGFGDPDVSAAIVTDMEANGGWITTGDLATYRVAERRPLEVDHGHARSLTNPAPSFGGSLVARALARLADDGPRGPFGSGPRLVQLVEVLDEVTRHHTQSSPTSSRGTTHVSIIDADGNLAAMTTSNGSGSGITLGDTGVLANNIMGETDLHPGGFHLAPGGQRVGSMMAPTILLPDDEPPIVLGSGGSERIRSALTQTIANLLDHGMSLEEAVLAPRLHWDGITVQVEPGFAPDAVADLARVHPVNEWAVTDLYFGGVHAVAGDGQRVGDPRRGGCTATLDGPHPSTGAADVQ